MRTPRILAGIAALAALAGCQTLDQMAQPSPNRAVATPSHATYCYRTLAAVNCYLAPRPSDTLVGVDVPPPTQPMRPKPAGEPAAAMPVAAPAPAAPPPVMVEPAPAMPKGPAPLSPYGNGGKRNPPAAEATYGYPPPPTVAAPAE